jgi:hypothetical protein
MPKKFFELLKAGPKVFDVYPIVFYLTAPFVILMLLFVCAALVLAPFMVAYDWIIDSIREPIILVFVLALFGLYKLIVAINEWDNKRRARR